MIEIRWVEHPVGTERRETLDPSSDIKEQLHALLQAHEAGPPVLARMLGPNGDRLLLGLGRPLLVDSVQADAPISTPVSCVVVERTNGTSLSSHGNLYGPDELLVWFIDGHWTELPGRVAVGLEAAAASASAFVSGSPPFGPVDWEQD